MQLVGEGSLLAAETWRAVAFPGGAGGGLDLDDASVAAARQLAAAIGLADRVRFAVADVTTLTDDHGYDLVMCVEVLHDLSSTMADFSA